MSVHVISVCLPACLHDCEFVCVCHCIFEYVFVCMCVCLGKDAQYGAGQGPRRGSGSGQSVAADPTVRSFSVLVSAVYCTAQESLV